MKEFKLKYEGKNWWCPKCGISHIINSSYSYRPRKCDKCGYKVWINGEYILDPDTGYRKLTIINYKEHKLKYSSNN